MHPNFTEILKPRSRDAQLLAAIDHDRLPRHMAVIMDGNGRWAKKRGKPRIFGHRAGADSVKAIVDTCARLQIGSVTLYAFSTENWKRPKAEVSGLMSMLKRYLKSELAEVHRNNIRFRAIGDLARWTPIRLIPVADEVPTMQAQFGEYYAARSVPAGMYGPDGEIATLGVLNVLVVRRDLPERAAA